MKVFRISDRNWGIELANALSAARDGDIIVVHSESQKEMGERALKRQHPGEKLSIVVSLEDISDAIDAAENKTAAINGR